jgi:hypothetical protein
MRVSTVHGCAFLGSALALMLMIALLVVVLKQQTIEQLVGHALRPCSQHVLHLFGGAVAGGHCASNQLQVLCRTHHAP